MVKFCGQLLYCNHSISGPHGDRRVETSLA
jgi:hypothetical protein